MDKDTSHPKHNTICRRLQMVIRSTSPFQSGRLSSEHQHNAMARVTPPANVVLMPDRCVRVSNNQPKTSHHVTSYDNHHPKAANVTSASGKTEAKPKGGFDNRVHHQDKVTHLPILGNENRMPSVVGESGHMNSAAAESINRMFSKYIRETKYRFQHTPSMVDTA